MKKMVDNMFLGNYSVVKEELNNRLQELVNEKVNQLKLRLAAEMYGDVGVDVEFVEEDLSEANVQKMGRTKMIRVRVRGGKVQRRIKKSAVPGFTLRGGKMVRMSTMERRHRKMAARRAKFKRRAKMKQAIRKRQRSLRRRKAMGL